MAAAKFKLEGHRKLVRKLDQLPIKVQRKVLRQSLNAAGTPIAREVRRNAKAIPDAAIPRNAGIDAKGIGKSIGKRTKTYRNSGVGVVVVGPRTNKGEELTAKQFGGIVAQIEKGTLQRAARPFVRPGFLAARSAAIKAMGDKMREAIKREAAKL